MLAGCATNPVSGKRQFMLMSESDEIQMDLKTAPHQFSADYGALQDPRLEAYIGGVGDVLAAQSHRPHMPYSFRGLNASYVNAYTFPGGSIGITRGILLGMESEAALAGLIGHEIGHVSSRHAAERVSKGMLAQILVMGVGVAVALKDERYAPLAMGLGGIGSGILLARYSRADEREADALGLQYMVQAGYSPAGMVELMDVLRRMEKHKPNALETMFASHPMSEERYQTAADAVRRVYASAADYPLHRERYLDQTAALRAQKPLVDAIQAGDEAMMSKNWAQAEAQYQAALKCGPDDYEALLKMAKCKLALKQPGEAKRYAEQARAVYPEEPQAIHVEGMAALGVRAFDQAARDFDTYGERLPGNPLPVFFAGLAYEGLGRRPVAIERYRAFLQNVQEGDEARHAYQRLIEWNVIARPVAQGPA